MHPYHGVVQGLGLFIALPFLDALTAQFKTTPWNHSLFGSHHLSSHPIALKLAARVIDTGQVCWCLQFQLLRRQRLG
jgi:hypothetical protein